MDDVRKLSVSDVVYVHINDAPAGIDPYDQIDNIRCLPAETGVIPLTELMQILTEIGYEGPRDTGTVQSKGERDGTRRCGESDCGIIGSGVGKRRSVDQFPPDKGGRGVKHATYPQREHPRDDPSMGRRPIS